MNKLVTGILLAISCLVPLIVKPFGNERFSYPKILFIYFCCIAIAAVIIGYKGYKNFKPLSSPQGKLISAYVLLCIISTIFSVNIANSLVGRTGRKEGLFAIICYIILFFAASFFYEFHNKHLNYIALTSIIVSIFGILQFMGYDLVCGFKVGSIWYKQCFSTIGHRNFVGSYICLMLPIMALSYIYLRKKLYFIASCALFLCLLSSTTRSAWLSLSVLLIFIFILCLKKILNIKAFLILIASFVFLFLFYNYINNGAFIARYTSIYSNAVELNDDSGSGRIFIWRNTVPLIWQKPLLGVGIDNLGEVFMEKYKDEAQKQMPDTYIDKAHNEFLQIAVTTGIPAMLVYISFLIILFVKSLKYILKDRIILALFCCILAYQMQAFLNISVTSVAPIMWILLGILNNKIMSMESKITDNSISI